MTERVTLPEGALNSGLYASGKQQDLGYIKEFNTVVSYDQWRPVYKTFTAGKWESCRESFQYRYNEDHFKEVMFKTTFPGRTEAFLEMTQDKIGLKDKDRLTVHKTQYKQVVLIKLSEWWQVPMRFNLLTILLRASRNYTITRGDFWGTLENNRYLGNQEAFTRFMDGYTVYKGKRIGKGWRSMLGSKKGESLEKLLVKPTKPRKKK